MASIDDGGGGVRDICYFFINFNNKAVPVCVIFRNNVK